MQNTQIIMSSHSELFYNNSQHVSTKWEHYPNIYHKVWQRFINQNPTVLEIGVQNGGSLQIASKYFINANIYGIDIDPKVCQMSLGENITTYCFDAKDKVSFNQHFGDTRFDTILDDGSHINSDIILNFRSLFPKIKPGGVYVIEDLHTSYWNDRYEGGHLKKTSAIEFLKKFVDILNAYYIHDGIIGVGMNQFIMNLSEDDNYILQWLESITFYDAVAVIHKLDEPREQQYKEIVSGYICPVECSPALELYKNNITAFNKLMTHIKDDIDALSKLSGAALYIAVRNGYIETIKLLLEHGTNIELSSSLYAAVEDNSPEIVKLLLEHGANTEVALSSGSTPLIAAAYFGFDEIVKLLLEHGANKNAQAQGVNAFNAALQKDHPTTAVILSDSQEDFCNKIQGSEYEVKYAELCGKVIEELEV